MNPPQTATGFWSIERFVAFILGPVVTAGSGWLSLFLAKKFGIKFSPGALTGVFATGGLAAGGLAYKWLHGRQVEMKVEGDVAKLEAIPGVGEFVHTTVHDLEGMAQSAATKAVAGVGQPPQPQEPKTGSAPSSQADVGPPPTDTADPTAADEGAASAEE